MSTDLVEIRFSKLGIATVKLSTLRIDSEFNTTVFSIFRKINACRARCEFLVVIAPFLNAFFKYYDGISNNLVVGFRDNHEINHSYGIFFRVAERTRVFDLCFAVLNLNRNLFFQLLSLCLRHFSHGLVERMIPLPCNIKERDPNQIGNAILRRLARALCLAALSQRSDIAAICPSEI
ncbi:hypothetical protein [Ereboglobus luteus]|nr:hypothetical protein [Ereboglobus luteus]